MKNKKGFTLIELMIVVAIIGILAALAIPDFMKMMAKSKQSEARSNLSAVFTAQTSYFGLTNTYGATFYMIDWAPEGRNLYTYHSPDDEAVDDGDPNLYIAKVGDSCQEEESLTTVAGSREFLMSATANIDNDEFCDEWGVDHRKNLVNVQNDVNDRTLTDHPFTDITGE